MNNKTILQNTIEPKKDSRALSFFIIALVIIMSFGVCIKKDREGAEKVKSQENFRYLAFIKTTGMQLTFNEWSALREEERLTILNTMVKLDK